MPRPIAEALAEQFLAWERVGRGSLPAMAAPVRPEPPFVPFEGYRAPALVGEALDDGRRPSWFGQLVGADLGPPAAPSGVEAQLAEPDSESACEWHEPAQLVEIGVTLPPDYAPAPEAQRQFIRTLGGLADPVAFEIIGRAGGTEVQLAVAQGDVERVEMAVDAFFPETGIDIRKGRLQERWDVGTAACICTCVLRDPFLFPLATGHRLDPLVGVVGALGSLPASSCVVLQVLIEEARQPWAESIERLVRTGDGSLVFPWEDELAKGAEAKVASPLYAAVVRLAVAGEDADSLWPVLTRVGASLGAFANPQGNALRPVASDGYPWQALEADLLARRSRCFGMLLGEDELLGLVHLPGTEVRSPHLERRKLRTHPAPEHLVPPVADGRDLYLGENNHRGKKRDVYLPADIRVRHMHVIGTPGSGKSNLLANMVSDDIERGQGVAVLDPHGDLIKAVMARVPGSRTHDVVLLDPSDGEASVGINVLSASSEAERTLLASDLVSMFERLSTTWGDQMNVILRNAILAYLTSDEGGTLADLRRFLVFKDVRDRFLPTVRDLLIREYWESFFDPSASKGSVNAVASRLGQLLESPTIRYVLGQKRSTIDFGQIMNSGMIFLCKLPAGLVGENDAHLFGSLVVAKLQQTAMARQAIPEEERRDFWLYIDEFQHFVTPSMAQIISETRKYRMGMVLAHQRLQQLEHERSVATAVELMNIKVVFEVGDNDARKLAGSFEHFRDADLRRLDQGHAVVRVGRSDNDFNLYVPLFARPPAEEAERTIRRVTAASAQRYARPRSEIDEEMRRAIGRVDSGTRDTPADAADSSAEAEPELPTAECRDAPADEPPKAPSPAEGRGGGEHRGAVKVIQRAAEELGFPSTIEKPLAGGGYVDVEVETPAGTIAFEVSVTTGSGHEIANVDKCLQAGYRRIVAVCQRKAAAERIRKHFERVGLPQGVELRQFFLPLRYPDVFKMMEPLAEGGARPEEAGEADEPTAGEGEGRVIGSRRVTSHFSAFDEAASRRQAERVLRLLEELMGTPPEEEES